MTPVLDNLYSAYSALHRSLGRSCQDIGQGNSRMIGQYEFRKSVPTEPARLEGPTGPIADCVAELASSGVARESCQGPDSAGGGIPQYPLPLAHLALRRVAQPAPCAPSRLSK